MSKPRKLPSKKWQARYYVTEGNRLVSRSAGTFVTKRDAQDAIDVELAKIRTGRWIDPLRSGMTFQAWADAWYAAREPRRKVRSFLDARILPQWKAWEIGDIRNLDVKAWVREMSAELAPETVRGVYTVFSTMMTDAARERVIDQSPCWPGRDALPPVQRTKLHYLTLAQGQWLVANAPAQYRALYHLALWTGMRWGELAALRWESVDLTAGTVSVLEAVKRENREIGLPKGNKTREVTLGAETVEALKAHRRDFGSGEFVFTSPRGRRLRYEQLRANSTDPLAARLAGRGEDPAPEELRIDWRLTFHSLRHTYVSTMLDSGVDALIVAEEAGHSRASFTIDRYGHARHTKAVVLREAMARAMSGDEQ